MPTCIIIRARLTPAMLICQGAGTVHSVFRSVVNVALPGRLLTVADAFQPDMPDTLYLPSAGMRLLRTVREAERAVWHHDTLTLGPIQLRIPWPVLPMPAYRPRPRSRDYARRLLEVCESVREPSGLDRLPPPWLTRVEASLRAYARALRQGSDGSGAVQDILGLGIGATPSADDAILAVSALLSFGPIQFPEALLRATSAISAKYLTCAQEGYYAAPLTTLLDQPSPEHARALAGCGASSGRDMLHGLRMACRQLIEEE